MSAQPQSYQRAPLATPADVENRLYALGRELDSAVVEVQQAETEYLVAKTEFEIGYARAYMSVEAKTVKDRESLALLKMREEREALTRAEALLKAHRENVKRIYTHVDVARSISVIVRAGIGAS